MSNGIREVEINFDKEDGDREMQVLFGPHHGLRIREESDTVTFRLVSTHHGFEVDAGDGLPTELEEIINEIRENYPEKAVETFNE